MKTVIKQLSKKSVEKILDNYKYGDDNLCQTGKAFYGISIAAMDCCGEISESDYDRLYQLKYLLGKNFSVKSARRRTPNHGTR